MRRSSTTHSVVVAPWLFSPRSTHGESGHKTPLFSGIKKTARPCNSTPTGGSFGETILRGTLFFGRPAAGTEQAAANGCLGPGAPAEEAIKVKYKNT